MTTLALPAAPPSPSVLIVNANEYLDARAALPSKGPAFAGEFREAEAAGLVKWMAGSQDRVHIDAAAADVILRVQEFQEQQRRDAAIPGEPFPVPSSEALKIR
jgi:hypothetical protein